MTVKTEPTERDFQQARRHLKLAIAELDRLQLHQEAAHADLALARLEERVTSVKTTRQRDWETIQ